MVACWTSDHWVVVSMFYHSFHLIVPLHKQCAKRMPETTKFNLMSVLFRKSHQTIICPLFGPIRKKV